ncbi:MAG: YggT family protein [Candidatus Sericytochromatia bacterium]|nr:YggT family protein [Candidatus Sericytochromatia bacterium]
MPFATELAHTIATVENILVLLIIVRALMSFFPNIDPYHPVLRGLDGLLEPIMRPFRSLVPPMGGIDLSPILAIFTLQIVSRLLISALI